MTWHLKDRELEKKVIAIDLEFVKKLSEKCEGFDNNKDGDFPEIIPFAIDIYDEKLKLFLNSSYVEKVPSYDPNKWNDYPAVTPPEGVLMRVECDNNLHTALVYKNNRWQFESGENFQGFERIYKVKRFRPWED